MIDENALEQTCKELWNDMRDEQADYRGGEYTIDFPEWDGLGMEISKLEFRKRLREFLELYLKKVES